MEYCSNYACALCISNETIVYEILRVCYKIFDTCKMHLNAMLTRKTFPSHENRNPHFEIKVSKYTKFLRKELPNIFTSPHL